MAVAMIYPGARLRLTSSLCGLGREYCGPYEPEYFGRKRQKVCSLADRESFAISDPPHELSQSLLKNVAADICRAVWIGEISV